MTIATVAPSTTGQRVGRGFTDMASTTETLYKFGKVVSSGFHIVVEALKLVPGAEGISSCFYLIQGHFDTSLKVIGATHIFARFGEWEANGSEIIKSWQHTANRVSLTFAQGFETAIFIDKITINFFDQPSLKVGNISILELAKTGFYLLASIFGLCRVGADLDAAYAEEKKTLEKSAMWTIPVAVEAPKNETKEASLARLYANERAIDQFIEERKKALVDKLTAAFTFFDMDKQDKKKYAHKLRVAKQDLATSKQALEEAKQNVEALKAAEEACKLNNDQIVEFETRIGNYEAICKKAKKKVNALLRKARKCNYDQKIAQLKKDIANIKARLKIDALENLDNNAEVQAKTLTGYMIEEYEGRLQIRRKMDDVSSGAVKISLEERKELGIKVAQLEVQLNELQKNAKKAKKAKMKVKCLEENTETQAKILSSYKIEKYKTRIQNCHQTQTKSWVSIAADISKILAILMVTSIIIASFYFPLLTGSAAVLIVAALSFIGYTIGFSNKLYHVIAPEEIKELTWKEYKEKKRDEETANAEVLVSR